MFIKKSFSGPKRSGASNQGLLVYKDGPVPRPQPAVWGLHVCHPVHRTYYNHGDLVQSDISRDLERIPQASIAVSEKVGLHSSRWTCLKSNYLIMPLWIK